jgi:hypothetical protein
MNLSDSERLDKELSSGEWHYYENSDRIFIKTDSNFILILFILLFNNIFHLKWRNSVM